MPQRVGKPKNHKIPSLGGKGFEILSRLGARLLTTRTTQTLQSIFDDLAENLDLEVYFNYEAVPDATALRLKSYRGASDHQAKCLSCLQTGEAVCGLVAHERRRVIAEDVQLSEDPNMELIRSMGIQAYVCFPLIAHGDLVGTLSFGSCRRTHFDEEELQLLEAVSTQIALSLERERQLASLRQHVELMELAQDMIMVRTLEGRILFWNRRAEETYGWHREEALGRLSHDLLKTEFPKPLSEIHADLLATGRWQGELVHTTRAGRAMRVSGRWALQHDENGHPASVLEVSDDLSARKSIEGDYKQAIVALERSQRELHQKIEELERFEEAVIGRELKMMELERQTDRLRQELERTKGEPPSTAGFPAA